MHGGFPAARRTAYMLHEETNENKRGRRESGTDKSKCSPRIRCTHSTCGSNQKDPPTNKTNPGWGQYNPSSSSSCHLTLTHPSSILQYFLFIVDTERSLTLVFNSVHSCSLSLTLAPLDPTVTPTFNKTQKTRRLHIYGNLPPPPVAPHPPLDPSCRRPLPDQ